MFSGVVKIADIDDYITPSQNCIKPILDKEKEILNKKSSKVIQLENTDFTENNIPLEPNLIKIKDKSKKSASVSLNDCLACNGCVTTAETLLIQAQSVDEFLKNSMNCAMEDKISVVCISPQSILSLSEYYSLNPEETLGRLCKILKNAGVDYLFNFNSATLLTLKQCYSEFKEKVLSGKLKYLISSECPGWICYAEKKIGDWVMPHLSNIKSPQQVLAHIVKKILMKTFNKQIYLTCIMPCFDKKLEATRHNYKIDSYLEVDTVISTIELLELFEKLGVEFEKLNNEEEKIYVPFMNIFSNNSGGLHNHQNVFFSAKENFSSNGYCEYILYEYIKEFIKDDKYKIERKLGKNSDYKEIFLYKMGLENPILSFCQVYGFRNIQNFVRNKNKSKYDYLEIMACPGGCLNGGGQLRPKDDNITPRDLFKIIEEKYTNNINVEKNDNLLTNLEEDINFVLDYLNKENYAIWENIFHTQFQSIDKLNTINLKW